MKFEVGDILEFNGRKEFLKVVEIHAKHYVVECLVTKTLFTPATEYCHQVYTLHKRKKENNHPLTNIFK